MKSIGIITPTIGTKYLKHNILSVQKQKVGNFKIKHYIIVDGREYYDTVKEIVNTYKKNIEIVLYVLEENVGKNGWYGHRVYASFPALMNTDYVNYLDEDNTMEDTFCQEMFNGIYTNIFKPYDYVYCLRNIIDENYNFICKDIAESLGTTLTIQSTIFSDTNCFLIKRELAIKIGSLWYGQCGIDRIVSQCLFNNFKNHICVHKFLINYMDRVVSNKLVNNDQNNQVIYKLVKEYYVGNIDDLIKENIFLVYNKIYIVMQLKRNGFCFLNLDGLIIEKINNNLNKLQKYIYQTYQLDLPKELFKNYNIVFDSNKILVGSIVISEETINREDIYNIQLNEFIDLNLEEDLQHLNF